LQLPATTFSVIATPRQRADPAPEARTPFVEIRLAALLISPPKKRALPDYWQGPSTPPVKGVDKNHIPKGVNLQWVMDVAWKWRGQQLREGGYGAVDWDDLIGRR
jgi:hypothetical protein